MPFQAVPKTSPSGKVTWSAPTTAQTTAITTGGASAARQVYGGSISGRSSSGGESIPVIVVKPVSPTDASLGVTQVASFEAPVIGRTKGGMAITESTKILEKTGYTVDKGIPMSMESKTATMSVPLVGLPRGKDIPILTPTKTPIEWSMKAPGKVTGPSTVPTVASILGQSVTPKSYAEVAREVMAEKKVTAPIVDMSRAVEVSSKKATVPTLSQIFPSVSGAPKTYEIPFVGPPVPTEVQRVEAQFRAEKASPKWFVDSRQMQRDIQTVMKEAEFTPQAYIQAGEAVTGDLENIGKEVQKISERRTNVLGVLQKKTDVLSKKASDIESKRSSLIGLGEYLDKEGKNIDLTDVKAVEEYNKKIEDLQKSSDVLNLEIESFNKEGQTLQPLYQSVDKLSSEIEMLKGEFEKGKKEATSYFEAAAVVPKLAAEKIEAIKGRSAFEVRTREIEKELEELERQTKPTDWRRWAGEATGYFGKGTMSALEFLGRKVPEGLIVSPIRQIEAAKARGESIPWYEGLAPVAIAKGFYDWKDPENVKYSTLTNLNVDAVTGVVGLGVIGYGGLAGKAAGRVVPYASKGMETTAKVLGYIGKGLGVTAIGAGVVGTPTYGRYKTMQAQSKIDEYSKEINELYGTGGMGKEDYDRARKYISGQQKLLDVTGISSKRMGLDIAGGLGEVTAIGLGAAGAAGFFRSPSALRGGVSEYGKAAVKEQYVIGRQIQTKGGPISAAKTPKGVQIEEPPLPGYSPGVQKGPIRTFTYQEQPSGFIKYLKGQLIKTKVSVTPSKGGYPGMDVVRTSLLGNKKYVTTQSAGQASSITKIYDKTGKLLRTVKEPPLTFGTAPGQIPILQSERELFPRVTKPGEVGELSTMYQKVGTEATYKLPTKKGVEGTGFYKSTAEERAIQEPALKSLREQLIIKETITPPKGKVTERFYPQQARESVLPPQRIRLGIGDEKINKLIGKTSRTITEPLLGQEKLYVKPTGEEVLAEPRLMSTIYTTRPPVAKQYTSVIRGKGTYIYDVASPAQRLFRGLGTGFMDANRMLASFVSTGIPITGTKGSLSLTSIKATGEAPALITTRVKGELALERGARTAVKTGTEYIGRLKSPTASLSYPPSFVSMPTTLSTGSVATLIGLTGASQVGRLISPTPKIKSESISRVEQLYGSKAVTGELFKPLPKLSPDEALTGKLEPTLISTTKITPIETTIPSLRSITGLISPLPYITAPIGGITPPPPIPGGFKFPTFGALGGGLLSGYGKGKGRGRGLRTWVVANPIAQFGEEWFARKISGKPKSVGPTGKEVAQRAVTRGFGGVRPFDAGKVKFLIGTSKGRI